MALKFLKHTWQKVTFYILLVLVLIVLIGAIFVNRYWSPILADKLKSTVLKSSDSLYRVHFDDAQLHVLQGKIVLYNITLDPDTAVYHQKRQLHQAPEKLYTLHVKKLVLKHIHPFRLYFKHRLDIGEIVLTEPELWISSRPDKDKDTTHRDHRTIYQRISKSLDRISVSQINLNSIKLHYTDYSTPKPAYTQFKDLDIGVTDLLIDSASQFDTKRFLYCRELTAELSNFSGRSANGLYFYQAKTIKFSTLSRRLDAYHCTFHATEPPFKFFSKTTKDRFVAYLDTLQVNNFDFETYSTRHWIKADAIQLSHGSLNVFGSPHKANTAIDRYTTFPQKAIHSIPMRFKIDTIRPRNIDVIYNEYNTQTHRTGHVDFTNTYGHFYNVTNDPDALKKENHALIQLKSRFMNKAVLNVIVSFNLTDSLGAFTYQGTLGSMNMSAANPATIPLASLAIKSGRVKSIDFKFKANRRGATGQLTFLYNDLRVQLLKADTVKQKMKHMPIATLFANAIIIKHNNPDDPGKTPRTATVIFKRHKDFPFFKSMWEPMLLGFKSCAGVDQKTEQQANTKMAEHEHDKLEKKQKKAERKKRREERRRKRKLKKEEKKAEKAAEKAAEN